ncbi:uncharacterized protein HaLaN_03748 [Haematococcus lacustris]|uniref:Uncharacterized protein n=1 Tax=Haematococcus lacustris TaxID=44745 RepID=A0A699Z075_HAELA|nr:uncharacterized protein HaLaN_03748 [Haematococcus lacustris]
MASIMQTGGPTQGWLYDPLTLEPLTNNTAMVKVLQLMADLAPFLRTVAVSSGINMAQQLTMSILPGSTEVLDRSTMQLVPCRQDLCNSRRTTQQPAV